MPRIDPVTGGFVTAACVAVIPGAMSHYTAEVRWSRGAQRFTDNRYSRRHVWRFDGGVEVPASASPHIVPLPLSAAEAVDPEEAFVASLASCHMLFFLSLAAKRGLMVDDYCDQAEGTLAPAADGRLAMTRVVLRPRTRFAGPPPARAEIEELHHRAHEECFLARSVVCPVHCEPRHDDPAPG